LGHHVYAFVEIGEAHQPQNSQLLQHNNKIHYSFCPMLLVVLQLHVPATVLFCFEKNSLFFSAHHAEIIGSVRDLWPQAALLAIWLLTSSCCIVLCWQCSRIWERYFAKYAKDINRSATGSCCISRSLCNGLAYDKFWWKTALPRSSSTLCFFLPTDLYHCHNCSIKSRIAVCVYWPLVAHRTYWVHIKRMHINIRDAWCWCANTVFQTMELSCSIGPGRLGGLIKPQTLNHRQFCCQNVHIGTVVGIV